MDDSEVSTVPVKFRLRQLLEGADISQTEAARRAGVSYATVNRMCTNATRQVSLDVLERLARVLDVEAGDLLERKPAKRR